MRGLLHLAGLSGVRAAFGRSASFLKKRSKKLFSVGVCGWAGGDARAVFVVVLLMAGACLAGQEPQPPCGMVPVPPHAAVGLAPAVVVHEGGAWTAPACSGWVSGGATLVVGLAAGMRDAVSAEVLLARFGQVSALAGVRYWSATDGDWRTLISAAQALDGPDAQRPRGDFSAAELAAGHPLYFLQQDTRSSGAVVYRVRVLVARPERIVIAVDNVTAVRLLWITLFAPGDLQSTFYLDRRAAGGWDYYALWGVRTGVLTAGHAPSSVNRGIAMFRHFAGLAPGG